MRVVNDVEGVEARRFGAQTSGTTSLYSPDGRLLFSGGITSSRGHEGDNAGEDALTQAISGSPACPKPISGLWLPSLCPEPPSSSGGTW